MSDYRYISRLTEWSETEIRRTVLKQPVAIRIQLPRSRRWFINANAGLSRAVPVSGDWEVPRAAKRAKAKINCTRIKLAIAIVV